MRILRSCFTRSLRKSSDEPSGVRGVSARGVDFRARGVSARGVNSRARITVVFAVFIGLLLAAAYLSLRCGSRPFKAAELLHAVIAGDASDAVYRIAVHVRLPRTAACAAAGSAFAVAGALTQSVLDNPMASPNVIGVNAGAGFAVLLVSTALPVVPAPVAAIVGALATTLLIYALAAGAGMARPTLILAGIAVNGILTSGINALRLLYPDAVAASGSFLLGSLSGVTMMTVVSALPYIAVGFIIAGLLASRLNLLALGVDSARSLGLNVGATRFLAVLAASALAGAAVSFAGLISFVGLLVPHAARRFTGSDNCLLLPASAILGASFVLLCDTAGRTLFAPYELPVGIPLSVIGGAFFLTLLLRGRRHGDV